MIKHNCRVTHDPARGMYGDCVRASVASILDIQHAEDVPHFFHDNAPGNIGEQRMKEYLASQGLMMFKLWFDGAEPLTEILETMNVQNPDVHYLLFGATDETDHVVVCLGDKVVHNTSWYPTSLTRPSSNGYWTVMIFVPLVLGAK